MLRSWRELRDARRKGRRDGRAGVPTIDQDALPFSLREMPARANERVHALVTRFTQDVRELDSRLADLTQRTGSAEARLLEAEMQHAAALADHERRELQEQEHLAALQGRLEDVPAVPTLQRTPGSPASPATPIAATPAVELGEVGGRGMGPIAYWALVTLIVVGEIPLNAFAFRLFHEADLLTYAMTVTVAVALVAMAHVGGLLVSRPRRTFIERVVIVVCVVVPLAVITVIALVRYGYLQDVGGDSGIGPILGTFAFGSINLLVFGAAVGASYLHHDPRTLVNRRATVRAAEKERTRFERRSAEDALARMRRARTLDDESRKPGEEAHKAEVLARRELIVGSMRPIREAARERLERVGDLVRLEQGARASVAALAAQGRAIETERRALRASADGAIRAVKAARDRLVFAYCAANVRARRGHGSPRCLDHVPPLEMSAAFEDALARGSST